MKNLSSLSKIHYANYAHIGVITLGFFTILIFHGLEPISIFFGFLNLFIAIYAYKHIGIVSKSINSSAKNLEDAISGNLEERQINPKGGGEISQLAHNINDLLDQIESFMREINTSILYASQNKFFRRIHTEGLNDALKFSGELINKSIDEIYSSIGDKDIDKNQSEYLQFCDKNKKLDLYIGYSLLITELEKSNIISNKIKPTIETLIDLLNKNEDDSERYKCSQCLYNILKSLFGTDELSDEYSIIINKLISEEKTMKIKFKFMDIIERK